MAELWALLPAADAYAIAACLDTTARALKQAHRTARTAAAAAAGTAGTANGGPAGTADPAGMADRDSAAADPVPGLDALRADALITAILHTRNPAPDNPDQHPDHPAGGLRPLIHVTVALTTLTGTDDEPGHLTGYGPITADTARDLAHDPTGTWRRLLTDPTGALTDYTTTRYRPPPRLTGLAVHRYGTCTFPGCARTAHRCDLDPSR